MESHNNLKALVINAYELQGDAVSFARRYQNLESLHITLYKFNWTDMGILVDEGPFKLVCTQRRYMCDVVWMYPDYNKHIFNWH